MYLTSIPLALFLAQFRHQQQTMSEQQLLPVENIQQEDAGISLDASFDPLQQQQQQQQVQDLPEDVPVAQFTPIDMLRQDGFNDKDIEKLKSLGIHTIDQAAHFSDKSILQSQFPESKLPKLRNIIAERCASTHFVTARDLLTARARQALITTRAQQLDNLLGGGLEPGTITEIYGEFNTGKTQFCHTIAVTAQLPRHFGGAQGRVLYIDSEGTFRPERVLEIAQAVGIDSDQTLDNILVARALNSDHQTALLKSAAEEFSKSRFALVIVDSATSLFRTDYSGRGQLSERQTSLAKFLRNLHALAQTYNVAAVVTNQVVSDIAGAAQMGGGDNKKPIGGNIMAHASTTRLQFRKGRGGNKVCKIVDSPLLAEGEAPFKIAGQGIVDADYEE